MLSLGLDGPKVDPGEGEGEGEVPVHCTRLTVLPRSGMRLALLLLLFSTRAQ